MSKRPNPYPSSPPPAQRQRLQNAGGQAVPARQRDQTYTVTTKPTDALPPKPTPVIHAPQAPATQSPQHHLVHVQPIPNAPPFSLPYFPSNYPYPAWLLQLPIQHPINLSQVQVESMSFSVLHGRGCSCVSMQNMPPEQRFSLFKEVWDYIEQYLNALAVPPHFLPQVPPMGSVLAPPDKSTQVKKDPGGDDLLSLQDIIRSREAQKASIDAELVTLTERAKAARHKALEELERVREELEIADKERKDLQSLQEERTQMQQEVQDLHVQLREGKEKVEQQRCERRSIEGLLKKERTALDEVRRDRKRLDEDIREKNGQLNSSKKELDQAGAEFADLRLEKAELEAEITKMENMIQDIGTHYTNMVSVFQNDTRRKG